jgi:hypothetical protein
MEKAETFSSSIFWIDFPQDAALPVTGKTSDY